MKLQVIYLSIIILGLILSFSLIRNLYNSYQNYQILASAHAKLVKLQQENAQITTDLSRVNDPNFIEREARERLGLVKPGEVIVILPPPGSRQASAAATSVNLPRPVWRQWLGLFFGV